MPARFDSSPKGASDSGYRKEVGSRYTDRERANGGYYESGRNSSTRGFNTSDQYGTNDRSGRDERELKWIPQRVDQEWERSTINLSKANKDQSFGIAVSGGRDNPHYQTGDTSIVVSDVLRGSPADGLLKIDDIITSVNNQSVENETHAYAVKCLKDSGMDVKLCIKRALPPGTYTPRDVKQRIKQETEHIVSVQSKITPPPYKPPPDHINYKTENVSPPEYRAQSQTVSKEWQLHRPQPPCEEVKMVARGNDEPVDVVLERNDLEPYGFSLGSQLFIQDVNRTGPASREGTLAPGDVILKINGMRTDDVRLTDALEMVRNSTNKIHLVVQKKTPLETWTKSDEEDGPPIPDRKYRLEEVTRQGKIHLPDDDIDNGHKMQTKNLYTNALEAAAKAETKDDLEALNSFKEQNYEFQENWRSPLSSKPAKVFPQEEVLPRSNMEGAGQSTNSSPRSSRSGGGTLERKDKKIRVGDSHLVTFRKIGGVGIQVAGGNQCGIFVAKVKAGTPAADAKLVEGDQIIMANDVDFHNITREEAVLALLSLDDDVRLIVQHRRTAFEKIRRDPGDSFFIKTHFNHESTKPEELSFKKGDIFHVWDTMYNGVVGSWQAQVVARSGAEGKIGLIPNRCRASQLALAEHLAESKGIVVKTPTNSIKRKSTMKKDRKKFISLDELDDKSFAEEEKNMNVPAYEKVLLKDATFKRPVILLGPIADIARDRLLKEESEKFALPEAIRDEAEKQQGGAPRRGISLSSIRAVIDSHKHCLLDVTPDAVDKINYAQLYPIVVYFRTPSSKVVREMREKALNEKQSSKLIKRLNATSLMLERDYSHLFTTVISIGEAGGWNQKLKDSIERLQSEEVWMSQDQVVEQDEMIFSQRNSFYSASEYNDNTLDSMGMDNSTIRSSIDEPYLDDHAPEPPLRVSSVSAGLYAPTDDDVFTERSERSDQESDRYGSKDRWFENKESHPQDQIDARYHDERETARLQYDDRDRFNNRDVYDERNSYDQREQEAFQKPRREEYIEGPSRPGYKPTGNIVKVLPSSEIAQEMRRSLRKTKQGWSSSETDSDYPRTVERPRPTERIEKDKGPSELEMEIKHRATSLRKVEPESELFREYDDRVGVKVSDLWAIDNDYRRNASQGYAPPQERRQQEYDDPSFEVAAKPRNTVVDVRREDQEVVAEAKYIPTKSYATVTRYDPDTERDKERRRYEVERETVTRYERRYEPDQPARDFDRRDGAPPQRPVEETVQVSHSKETESAPRYVSHFSFSQKNERDDPPERQYEPRQPEPRQPEPRQPEPRQPEPRQPEPRQPEPRQPEPRQPEIRQSETRQTSYSGSLPRPYGTSYSNQSDAPRNYGYEYKYTSQDPGSNTSGGYISTTTTYTTKTETINDPEKIDDSQNAVTSDFESIDDDHQVIATAKGMFDHRGGVLSSPESGVSIYIPEGAIPPGKDQEIYFKVCKDNNFLPPLDTEKGETLLSPLVMCGPHGTQFLKPVELRLPHCASMSPDGWSFALKSSDAQAGEGQTKWQNMALGEDKEKKCQVDSNSVSVLVDHFSWFAFTGLPNRHNDWL